jgi:hypothetical protein
VAIWPTVYGFSPPRPESIPPLLDIVKWNKAARMTGGSIGIDDDMEMDLLSSSTIGPPFTHLKFNRTKVIPLSQVAGVEKRSHQLTYRPDPTKVVINPAWVWTGFRINCERPHLRILEALQLCLKAF